VRRARGPVIDVCMVGDVGVGRGALGGVMVVCDRCIGKFLIAERGSGVPRLLSGRVLCEVNIS
jgi:hypothetical protein